MKNKVLLMFLAIGGLLLSPHSSYATTQTNTEIAQTIAKLTNLAPTHQDLVEAAIQRALIAKEIKKESALTERSLKGNDAGTVQGQIQTNSISGRRGTINSGSSRSNESALNESKDRSNRIQIQHIPYKISISMPMSTQGRRYPQIRAIDLEQLQIIQGTAGNTTNNTSRPRGTTHRGR
jgi:hypothetical protein